MSDMNDNNGSPGQQGRAVDSHRWLSLYRCLVAAREIDRLEFEYVRRGLAFFHVSGAGHEATAALGCHLSQDDWLHCHYRDKALLLMRGLPYCEFFMSLLCKAGSHSAGRQMSAHLSSPALNVLSIVGPVGNNALQAAGVAAELVHRGRPGIVVCSVGDGSTQQGEFLEAVAEAVRENLSVLFLIQDNGWAISTASRGRTFYSRNGHSAREFYGLPIVHVNGRDPIAAHRSFGRIVAKMREERGPALVWFEVERLADHSNADDQTAYRDQTEIEAALRDADPVANM
ncbi:MAG TPA: thiamine pyrophosphate-dependent dehydrogenase E1 component subunit alpha, partial [Planctomycetaceae bacterium]|nr:thiamine pyrophosphate-dependent dehydrogenase E1 component subunit alpha [Planctomycetaceae bacterium]